MLKIFASKGMGKLLVSIFIVIIVAAIMLYYLGGPVMDFLRESFGPDTFLIE